MLRAKSQLYFPHSTPHPPKKNYTPICRVSTFRTSLYGGKFNSMVSEVIKIYCTSFYTLLLCGHISLLLPYGHSSSLLLWGHISSFVYDSHISSITYGHISALLPCGHISTLLPCHYILSLLPCGYIVPLSEVCFRLLVSSPDQTGTFWVFPLLEQIHLSLVPFRWLVPEIGPKLPMA